MITTTVLSLIGGGLGAVMRLLPEVFKLFTLKRDQDHEFRMSKLQLEIDKTRAEQQIDLVHAQSNATQLAGEMQAYIEAIKGQAQPTGVRWIDGLSQSIRPVLTIWWQLLFTVYKLIVMWVAWSSEITLSEFAERIWTPEDWGVLSMILGFWFVDRTIRKGNVVK